MNPSLSIQTDWKSFLDTVIHIFTPYVRNCCFILISIFSIVHFNKKKVSLLSKIINCAEETRTAQEPSSQICQRLRPSSSMSLDRLSQAFQRWVYSCKTCSKVSVTPTWGPFSWSSFKDLLPITSTLRRLLSQGLQRKVKACGVFICGHCTAHGGDIPSRTNRFLWWSKTLISLAWNPMSDLMMLSCSSLHLRFHVLRMVRLNLGMCMSSSQQSTLVGHTGTHCSQPPTTCCCNWTCKQEKLLRRLTGETYWIWMLSFPNVEEHIARHGGEQLLMNIILSLP